ncbi:MAG: ABC transporter substrate-binding protein [Candidatus Nanopelagicales bacterium]
MRMKFGVVAITAVAALALAGCGSSSTDTTASTTPSASASATSASLNDMLPADIKAKGSMLFGVDASYAPDEYVGTDGKTIEGMDIDLMNAIVAKLGIKAEYVNAPFDSIIPAIGSGKYDGGMSSFTINAEREKVVDFVSYYTAGTSWAAPVGSKLTPDTACGHKIAVQKGTVEVDDINARNAACKKAGKPSITIDQYQAQSDATTAVVSGKDEAMLADSPITGYAIAQSSGKLALIGSVYGSAPYGIALPKAKGDLAKAFQAAVQAIMDDGTYNTILQKWGATDGAITKSEINPA